MENGIIIDMKRRSNIDLSSAKEYRKWIAELKVRYRATQIKAAVAVNSAMLEFYWNLGQDIAAMYPGKQRNAHFFENLSNDLCLDIPNPIGLSPSNIRYALRFYELYRYLPQVVEDNSMIDLMKVPWGHHRLLVDKSRGDRNKALFYVRKTIENGWSRNDLQIAIGEDVYEKTGRALVNFDATLPMPSGYLANELIKNEYSFALTETVDNNNERQIEAALVRNITRTLTELGGGGAYVGIKRN